MANEQTEIKIYIPNEIKGGAYANNMFIFHSEEEFILDFLMVVPPEGAVTARVIVSPGHMKRIFNALGENIAKYEEAFGPIKAAQAPALPPDYKQ